MAVGAATMDWKVDSRPFDIRGLNHQKKEIRGRSEAANERADSGRGIPPHPGPLPQGRGKRLLPCGDYPAARDGATNVASTERRQNSPLPLRRRDSAAQRNGRTIKPLKRLGLAAEDGRHPTEVN